MRAASPSWSEVVIVLTVGANGASLSILVKHMARMESGWLYDETVNAFLYLLREREALLCRLDTTRTSIFFYNSYFFEKLLGTVNGGITIMVAYRDGAIEFPQEAYF